MHKLTTKEIMDEYFKNIDAETSKRIRPQVDRDELYCYEKKIGKELLDMTPEECFSMLISFQNENKYSISYEFSYQSFLIHTSTLRSIINWYIENHEVLKNPFMNSFFRNTEVIQERLSRSRTVFTTEKMEGIINSIQSLYNQDRADYIELIIRLFYAGFSEEAELAAVTPDMIDYDRRLIELPSGKNISITDRLMYLMKKMEATSYITESNGRDYAFTRSGKRWMKYIILPSKLKELNNKDTKALAKNIAQVIEVYIRQPLDIKLTTRTIYLLGVYDRLCSDVGEKKVYELVMKDRTKECTELLMKASNLQDPSDYNVSYLKRDMKLFIDFSKYDIEE